MTQTTLSKTKTSSNLKGLRQLIKTKDIVRLLEAHNGLTALIVEKTRVLRDDHEVEFDAIWESSLTDSASKGKPDISIVDMTSRTRTVLEIMDVTTKPIVVDADNGGVTEIFAFTVHNLERIGVSAVIIEDKIGEKRNSLFGDSNYQQQDSTESFAEKIRTGKASQTTEEFMIIARIESLICGAGMNDALDRAESYIKAGADGIMIHSNSKSPDEILEFCKQYKLRGHTAPLVVVPSTYNSVTESELINAGAKVVIYANQLLRSAYPAMQSVAEEILYYGRSLESDSKCMPIPEILELIPISPKE